MSEQITITVRPVPHFGIPPDVRLRKWIKSALRGYGIQVIALGTEPETDEQRRERLRQQAIEIDAEWNRLNGW